MALAITPHCALAQDFSATLDKANAYIEAAKDTERAVDSWDRYASWVNMKTGPTGKERYISYGMYDLPDVSGILKEVTAAAGREPLIPLDKVMTDYLESYEALAPVMNKAAAYYDHNGYERDKAAEGKALHKQLVPLATVFMAKRDAMMPELRAFVREVASQQVAAIEKEEGRTARWQSAQIMHAADTVFDAFPHTRPQQMTSDEIDEKMGALGPDSPGEKFDEIIAGVKPSSETIDVKRFSSALQGYAAAVEVFDQYKGETPDDFDELKPLPRRLLDMLRAFQGPVEKSQGREFEGGAQMAGEMYQLYIEMLNASSPIMQSQLRYLP